MRYQKAKPTKCFNCFTLGTLTAIRVRIVSANGTKRMNRQTTERLAKRLDAIEARQPDRLPAVILAIVEPSEDGPRRTGEEWRMLPGGAVKVAHARH